MSNPNEKFASQRYLHPSPGVGAVGQYQLSGIPYASSSIIVPRGGEVPLKVEFPYVTKFVTVLNAATGSNKPLRVGFSSFGVTGSEANDTSTNNFFVLDNGESYTGEFRVHSIYLLGANVDGHLSARTASPTTASVIAGMTGIPAGKLQTNWSGTSGVG